MIERKYTVREIDRMRDALSHVYTWKMGEDVLRTYMMAGIDPDEVIRETSHKLRAMGLSGLVCDETHERESARRSLWLGDGGPPKE